MSEQMSDEIGGTRKRKRDMRYGGKQEEEVRSFNWLLYLLRIAPIAISIMSQTTTESTLTIFAAFKEMRDKDYMKFAKIFKNCQKNDPIFEKLTKYISSAIDFHIGEIITTRFPCIGNGPFNRMQKEYWETQGMKQDYKKQCREDIVELSEQVTRLHQLMKTLIKDRNVIASQQGTNYLPQENIHEEHSPLWCTNLRLFLEYPNLFWRDRRTKKEREKSHVKPIEIAVCIHFIHYEEKSPLAQRIHAWMLEHEHIESNKPTPVIKVNIQIYICYFKNKKYIGNIYSWGCLFPTIVQLLTKQDG